MEKSFLVQMLAFFGTKPEQTRLKFAQEVKACSLEDRQWFAQELTKQGYPCPVPAE
jgi:hypothetical protein